MTDKNIFRNRRLHCAFWVALVGTSAGCVVEPVGGRAYVAAPVVVAAPVGIEGGLIYYPDYEVYFDPGARAYWYARGGGWIRGPRPEGISVNVLLASPSVRMDFRDSPAYHHGEIVRRYPHGWRPENRGNERRDH
jgi:hypothetical protein